MAAERAKAEMERLNEDVRLLEPCALELTKLTTIIGGDRVSVRLHRQRRHDVVGGGPAHARSISRCRDRVRGGGAYFSREFAILARNLAEAYFGRPRLVRETSRVRAARLRDLASFVFGKAVRAPLAVVKDRARFAGEEGVLAVRIVVDRVGNGASIIGSWLRDEGTTLLDVCRALGDVKNMMMALVELLGLRRSQ